LTTLPGGSIPYREPDVNVDGRISVAEAVFILQMLEKTDKE
jgi:hypothetical protein